jgi:hypothetical protein
MGKPRDKEYMREAQARSRALRQAGIKGLAGLELAWSRASDEARAKFLAVRAPSVRAPNGVVVGETASPAPKRKLDAPKPSWRNTATPGSLLKPDKRSKA